MFMALFKSLTSLQDSPVSPTEEQDRNGKFSSISFQTKLFFVSVYVTLLKVMSHAL